MANEKYLQNILSWGGGSAPKKDSATIKINRLMEHTREPYQLRITSSTEKAPQYTPQFNKMMENKVAEKEEAIKALGGNVTEKYKRSNWDRIIDALQVGQYPVMSALYNATDNNPNTKVLQGLVDGLKSANPIGKDYKEGEKQFSDVLGNLGWNPQTTGGKVARGTVGLVGDIVLDPTTYIGLPLLKILKGTGTKVGNKTVTALSDDVAEGIIKNIAKGMGASADEISERVATEAPDLIRRVSQLQGIAKNTDKGFGIGFRDFPFAEKLGIDKFHKDIISEKTLREFGDKTIAPYVNSALEKLGDSKLAKAFVPNHTLKTASKTDPEGVAKWIKFLDYHKGNAQELSKANKAIQDIAGQWKQVLSPQDQKLVSNIIERGDEFTKLMNDMPLNKTKEAEQIRRKLIKYQQSLQSKIDELASKPTGVPVDLQQQYKALVTLKDELGTIVMRGDTKNYSQFSDLLGITPKASQDLLNSVTFMEVPEIIQTLKELPDFQSLKDDELYAKAMQLRKMADEKINALGESAKYFKGEEPIRELLAKISGDKPKKVRDVALPEISITALAEGAPKLEIHEGEEFMDALRRELQNSKRGLFEKRKPIAVFESVKNKLEEGAELFDFNTAKNLPHESKYAYIRYLAEKHGNLARILDNAGFGKVDEIPTKRLDILLDAIYNKDPYEIWKFKHIFHPRYDDAQKILNQRYGSWQKLNRKYKDKWYNDLQELLYGVSDEHFAKHMEIASVTEESSFGRYVGNAEKSRDNFIADLEAKRYQSDLGKPYFGTGYNPEFEKNVYKKISGTRNIEITEDVVKTQNDLAQSMGFESYEKATDKVKKQIDNYIGAEIVGEYYLKKELLKDAPKAPDPLKGHDIINGKFIPNKEIGVIKPTKNYTLEENIDSILKNGKGNKHSGNIDAYGETGKIISKFGDVKDYNTFNYNGINIKSPVNVSSNQTTSIDDVRAFIDALPEKVQKFLADRNIEIRVEDFGVGDADSLHRINDKLIQILHGNTKGTADAINAVRKTTIFPHEVGHAIGADLAKSRKIPKGWADAVKKDGKEFVSVYAEKTGKPSEDFAESVAKYISDPEKFINDFPNRAEIVQKAIDGISIDEDKIKILDTMARQQKQMPRQAMETIEQSIREFVEPYKKAVNEAINTNKNLKEVQQKFEEVTKVLSDEKEFETYLAKIYGTERAEKIRMKNLNVDENIKKAVDFFSQEFKRMWGAEANQDLIQKRIENYFTHMLNPNIAKNKKKYADIVDEYGLGKTFNPFSLERTQFIDKKTGEIMRTAREINELMEKNKGVKDFFIEEILPVYMHRAIKHNEMMYDKKFADNLTRMFGREVRNLTDVKKNEKVVVSTLELRNFIRNQKHGGQPRDTLKALGWTDTILDSYKAPFLEVKLEQLADVLPYAEEVRMFSLPNYIYDSMNQAGKLQFDNDTKALLSMYDKWLHIWKLNVTAVIPGFHARNAYANNFQNYLDLGMEALNPKTQTEAIKVLRGMDGIIKDRFGKIHKLADIREYAERIGILDSGLFAKDLPMEFSKSYNIGKANLLNKINPTDVDNFIPYKLGREVGNNIENQARLVNFIGNIKRGLSYQEAAEHVNKFLFDYNDITEFERHFMKRAIPFYTWMRKNAPLQLEQMFTNPKRYQPIAKVWKEIEGITPTSDRVDKKYINDFAQDWIQMPVKVKNPDGREEPVFWNPNLPVGDIDRIPNPLNIPDAVQTILTQSSPFIKVPIELSANKNMFFDSPINRGMGHTENMPGWLSPMAYIKGEKPPQISPELAYILSQLSSLKNVGEFIEKKGRDRGVHALNTLGGIKTASYDYDKYKTWALRDRLKELETYEKVLQK